MADAIRDAAEEAIRKIDLLSTNREEAPQARVPELTKCPRCGHNMGVPVAAPSEADVKEYVRCLLGKKKFSKTYPLFNGEVTLRYELVGQKESALLSAALDAVDKSDAVKMMTAALRLKLLFYLRQFNGDSFSPPEEIPEGWESSLFNKRFEAYGEDMPVLASRVLMEFMRLTEMLPEAGLDRGFYEGAGLG
jgi:hypothetical protein